MHTSVVRRVVAIVTAAATSSTVVAAGLRRVGGSDVASSSSSRSCHGRRRVGRMLTCVSSSSSSVSYSTSMRRSVATLTHSRDACVQQQAQQQRQPCHARRGYVTVETSATPNPDCLRFFSMDLSFLQPGFSIDIPSVEHAYKSPLAERLFDLDGVDAVFIADEYVTVRKRADAEWSTLVPQVQDVLVEFAASKQAVLSAAGEEMLVGYNDDTAPEDDDDEVVLAVKELLATRIRPLLRGDGGNVRYLDMDDGTVFLLLEGACRACPSSHITLKSGIERMLMHWIPEVVEAQEVSDDVARDILAEKRRRREQRAATAAKDTTASSTPPSSPTAATAQGGASDAP